MSPDPLGKITLIVLLFSALIVGALLSYIWVMGYYIGLGINVPEVSSVVITDVSVSPRDPTYFNLSILNPSFSPSEAKILRISVLTSDGVIHNVKNTYPPLQKGLTLQVGESKILRCYWNWADYAGETVRVAIFLDQGSGATFQKALPFVNILITRVNLNPKRGNQLNLTIENSPSSVTYVNITGVTVLIGERTEEAYVTDPQLPVSLYPGDYCNLTCLWTWTHHQDETITIIVNTQEGYTARSVKNIPTFVILRLTSISFNPIKPSKFNVTITNDQSSAIAVNLTGVYITFPNGTSIGVVVLNPRLPYALHKNETVTLNCLWDWNDYRDQEISVTVITLERYKVSATSRTPP